MASPLAPPVMLSLAAGLGTLYLVWRLWDLRSKPGAGWLLLALGGQAVACFDYAGALLVFAPGPRSVLAAGFWLAVFVTAVGFLAFALDYTGRGGLLRTWWFRAYLLGVAVTGLLVVSNPLHGLVWRRFEVTPVLGLAGVDYAFGPVAFLSVLGGSFAVLVGAMLLFDTVASYGPLYRGEAIAVGLSPLPPLVGLLVWVFELGPLPALNLTTVLFLPHVLIDLYAFVYSDMFEFHPATRRAGERAAIEDLGSPVAIVDEQGRVVTVNGAAREDFGLGLAAVRTEPLAAHLEGEDLEPAAGEQVVQLHTPAGPRQYSVVTEELQDSRGTHVGYTLVFRDVTAERRREQRLEVLNRILRHNLRNDLNAVQGFLQAAEDRVADEETAAMLERARRTTRSLMGVGENARSIEAALQSDRDRTTVDLSALAGAVADDLARDHPEATVDVAVPAGTTLETDRQLLRTVLENLVENGIVHGTGQEPGVTVRLEAAADTSGAEVTTLVVADDGPGIPDHELEVIRAGEETDLAHGSGLGLWLVDWGVRSLGGTVDFETGPGGTTVRLSFQG